MDLVFNLLFLVFSVFVGIRSFAYGVYEVRQNGNKVGGVAFIAFCLVAVLFCNVMVWGQ